MSYTYNDNFVVFNFLYDALAREYTAVKNDLEEDSREGFETLYIKDSSALKRFTDRHRQTRGAGVEPEIMDAAWRRIEGMELTLIDLLKQRN